MVNFKWDQKCALENAKEEAERNAAIRNAISLLQDGIPLKSRECKMKCVSYR